MKGWGWFYLALLFAPVITVRAGVCADTSPERSERALESLRAKGAAIEYRDEVGGPGKLMVTTDGRWRGSDADLAALKDVVGLYKLRLGANVTDKGLAEVARVCGLSSLDIHSISVTDDGIGQLAPLTGLRRLNLTYTKVSDRGLLTFKSWTQLQWLGLSYTRVTRAGIEGLKQALSDTVIEGNPAH